MDIATSARFVRSIEARHNAVAFTMAKQIFCIMSSTDRLHPNRHRPFSHDDVLYGKRVISNDDELDKCLFGTYVDDVAIIGSAKAREYVEKEIKKYFNTKDTGILKDCIGVNVYRKDDYCT